jgi:hypothetical protein
VHVRSATPTLTARALGSLLLVAGSVLMGLSTSGGGGASALERTPPRSPLSAVEAPACIAPDEAQRDIGAVLPTERCRVTTTTAEIEREHEARADRTTTSCSTTEEESTDPRRAQQGAERVATTTTESSGRALSAARTTTTTTAAAGAAGLDAGVSGVSSIPAGSATAPATGGTRRVAVTAIPRTGAAPPFGLGFGLGLGGLGLVGLSTRRPRRRRD